MSKKKVPCREYSSGGKCYFGASCHFSHAPTQAAYSPSPAPKIPCRSWTSDGSCKYRDNCHFDHSQPTRPTRPTRPIVAVPEAFVAIPASYPEYSEEYQAEEAEEDPSVCRNWAQTGTCKYGSRCHFASTHISDSTTLAFSPFHDSKSICKNWTKETACSFGKKCSFAASHEPKNSLTTLLRIINAGKNQDLSNFLNKHNLELSHSSHPAKPLQLSGDGNLKQLVKPIFQFIQHIRNLMIEDHLVLSKMMIDVLRDTTSQPYVTLQKLQVTNGVYVIFPRDKKDQIYVPKKQEHDWGYIDKNNEWIEYDEYTNERINEAYLRNDESLTVRTNYILKFRPSLVQQNIRTGKERVVIAKVRFKEKKEKPICLHWSVKGVCSFQSKCHYAASHIPSNLPKCIFYTKRGGCKYGTKCRRRHTLDDDDDEKISPFVQSTITKLENERFQLKWLDDSHKLQPYTPRTIKKMISLLKEGKSEPKIEIKIGEHEYVIDFLKETQKNKITKKKRVIAFQTQIVVKKSEAESGVEAGAVWKLKIMGLAEDIATTKIELKKVLDQSVFKKSWSSSSGLLLSEIKKIVSPLEVDVKQVGQSGSTSETVVYELKGRREAVIEALAALNEKEEASKGEAFPTHWEFQGIKNCVLKSLRKDSDEWKGVIGELKALAKHVTVQKIERIQNKFLFLKYCNERKTMKIKNKKSVTELRLFHGTHKTAPSAIYNGEEGFDMRFSGAGMWGQGIYFAAEASYSHSYSHKLSSPSTDDDDYTQADSKGKPIHQLFLASVMVGESYTSKPDSSLKMPPERKASLETLVSGGVKFETNRYDSVNGETSGTKVYIIYSNSKAYPLYLISYTVN